jgi:hypothetical protein
VQALKRISSACAGKMHTKTETGYTTLAADVVAQALYRMQQ